jgi:glycine/D-amino acid oxidase-like deaminating enzyme
MMNLSFWERNSLEKIWDVIIIGGGITGLNTAIQLHKMNTKLKICILEKELIGNVASTKNAGFVCLGSPSEILSDLKNYGEDTVYQNVSLRWKGINQLFKNVSKRVVQYTPQGGYDALTNQEESKSIEILDNLDTLNKILQEITKIYPFYTHRNDLLPTFGLSNGFSNLFKMEFESQINSYLLLENLQKRVILQNTTLLKGMSVSKYELINDTYHIQTENGIDFKGKKIVLATNALTNQLTNDYPVKPGRGLVIVSRPLKKQILKGSFHAVDGYIYFRNVENRLLIGGGRNIDIEGEATPQFGINDKIKDYLVDYAQSKIITHEAFEIDYCWSGIMGFTPSKTTHIEVDSKTGAIIAAGLNGMGVAIGAEIGRMAAKLVLVKSKLM